MLRQGAHGRDVRHLQRLLGVKVDGVFGPGTAQALREAQRELALEADGVAGPLTFASLEARGAPVAADPEIEDAVVFPGDLPPWLTIALKDLGVREIPGPEAHPRIVKWFDNTTLRSTSDEVPNCAAAVCTWLEEAEVFSPRNARARSFETWGDELDLAGPLPIGAVMVFARGKPGSGQGHVGLYCGGNQNRNGGGRVALLGANQGDLCCIKRTPCNALLSARWPEGWDLPALRYHDEEAVLSMDSWGGSGSGDSWA